MLIFFLSVQWNTVSVCMLPFVNWIPNLVGPGSSVHSKHSFLNVYTPCSHKEGVLVGKTEAVKVNNREGQYG